VIFQLQHCSDKKAWFIYLNQGYIFISISLFVNRITKKATQLTFTKFGVEVAHGPQKKPLVFVGNLDHVTLGLWLGRVRVTVRAPPYSTWEDMRYPAFFY